jgi:hypothetical protein
VVKSSDVAVVTAPAAGVDAGAAWRSAPHPVLVISPSGLVRAVNDAAMLLFPAARAGAPCDDALVSWLADAHQRFTDTLRPDDEAACGPVGGRSFEARPSRAENGDVVWWLVDDTARRSAEEALRAERERTAFLVQVSAELLASLNADRCMDGTARLATQYLADAAVVVAPPSGRWLAMSFCGSDGRVVRDKVVADPTSVPGLAEALKELLPPRLQQLSGVELAGGYRASNDTDRVGGDFCDVHAAAGPDEESLVVLGDVCGKGLEAAVQTGKIRNTLHALLPLATDHQRVLRLLNGALLDSDHTRFATLVLASVARRGGTVRLRVTSAGHPAPLVVRADGRVEEAATRGSLAGALPEVTSTTAALDLAPGESCLLYTDGITEAMGGPLGDALFGEARLRSALSECAGLPAEAVVERIRMLAAQWVGAGRHDDMAVVAITAPHHAHLSAVDGHTRGRYTA